jgi:hypothetical protein
MRQTTDNGLAISLLGLHTLFDANYSCFVYKQSLPHTTVHVNSTPVERLRGSLANQGTFNGPSRNSLPCRYVKVHVLNPSGIIKIHL